MRRILLLLLSCLFFTFSQAQTFSGALVAGMNMSQIDGDNLAGFRRLGLNTGIRVGAKVHEKWQLSLELLYSQQGANRSTLDPINDYDKIQLNFVEAPVMINFRDWKILASTGLSYNRLINYSVTSITGEDITIQEQYKSDVLAIVVGATYFFSENWGVNVRWSKHLTDFRLNDEGQFFRGRNIGIRLYYLL